MNIHKQISKPTLVINKEQCLKNIEKMAQKAKRNNVIFRPHFKTHYLAEVGEWFKDYGVDAITVSSVTMAEYFYKNEWRDITIAFPVNILEIDGINNLAKDAKINLLVFSRETIDILNSKLRHKAGVFIKVDTGMGRTGITAEDTESIDLLVNEIIKSDKLQFKGFLAHAGHTYNAGSVEAILKIHEDTKRKLIKLKQRYISYDKNIIVSCGDTPSCSLSDDFSGMDEIRPGNFIYYDTQQYTIGSCSIDDIAACVACPVVGKEKARNEVFIYGGAIHLSKDFLASEGGLKHFGLIVLLGDKKWSEPLKNTYMAKISQEHGIIRSSDEYFDKFNVGDLVGVIPVHSCLTANLLREDYVVV